MLACDIFSSNFKLISILCLILYRKKYYLCNCKYSRPNKLLMVSYSFLKNNIETFHDNMIFSLEIKYM